MTNRYNLCMTYRFARGVTLYYFDVCNDLQEYIIRDLDVLSCFLVGIFIYLFIFLSIRIMLNLKVDPVHIT